MIIDYEKDYIKELGPLTFGSRLKRLSDYFLGEVKRIYKQNKIDYEPKWCPLFNLIKTQPGVTLTEAAERLRISHAAVSQFSSQMKKAGLIDVKTSKTDERTKILVLSEKGEEIYRKMTPIWKILRSSVQSVLDDSGIDILSNLIALEGSIKKKGLFEVAMEKMSVEIVNYDRNNPDHAKAFYDLNVEWLEKYFEVEDYDKKVLANPEEYLLDKDGEILFAVLDKKMVGTVALFLRKDGRYELTKLGVNPEYQGLKIGKKLTVEAINCAKAKGYSSVYLESNTCLTPAISLYRKLGFTEVHTDVHSEYCRCNIKMELDLSIPTSAEEHPYPV